MSPVLPSDPEITDIEALGMIHRQDHWPVLEEDARDTVEGIVGDVRRIIDGVGTALLAAWKSRRTKPTDVPQPLLKQWPKVRRTKQHFFEGYHRGSLPFAPSSFTVNPNFVRRLQAAALDDAHSGLWMRP